MPELLIGGARIAYRRAGHGTPAVGTPVVLLHCSASSSGQWRALTEALQPTHQVLAPDLYGYGRSDDWPPTQPLSLAAEGAIVRSLLGGTAAATGTAGPTGAAGTAGPAHIVGHSYGGAVALATTRRREVDVARLVLIEPVAFHLLQRGGDAEQTLFAEIELLARTVSDAAAAGAAGAAGEHARGMAHFIDYWSGAGAWDRLSEEVRRDMAPRLPKVAQDFLAIISEPATLADYAAIETPTLILCGEQTHPAPRRIAELLADTLPRARLHTIPGAGHMSPLTHTDAVNAAITAHLAG